MHYVFRPNCELVIIDSKPAGRVGTSQKAQGVNTEFKLGTRAQKKAAIVFSLSLPGEFHWYDWKLK